MSSPESAQLIFCTCPDQATAEKIAHVLVETNLAACVNCLPGTTSIFQWQGQIESVQEHLLLIKSHRSRYQALEAAIVANHPYEVPEIIAISIDQGSPAYLRWIDSCVSN